MRFPSIIRISLAALGLVLTAGMAQADEVSLGTFKDWQAYSFKEGDKNVCVVWGKPREGSGQVYQAGRGSGLHRAPSLDPAETGQTRSVSKPGTGFGRTVKPPSRSMAGSLRCLPMATQPGNRSAKDDAAMVKAMRIGKKMVVNGVSGRGTKND